MRDSTRVEKSHNSVLGMTGTTGAGEEKTPAAVETSVLAGAIKGGAGEVLIDVKDPQPSVCGPRIASVDQSVKRKRASRR
jgi:hypothetical protein